MNKNVRQENDLICEVCGKFEAFEVGDRHLCADCFQNAGSCCPEFGGFDLWKDKEEGASTKPTAPVSKDGIAGR